MDILSNSETDAGGIAFTHECAHGGGASLAIGEIERVE